MGQARAPAERQQDADGQREHDARDPGNEVEHEAAKLVGGDALQAEAADQQEGGDQRIGEREPAPVAGEGHPVEQQIGERRHQQDEADVHAPMGIGRVEAVEELIDALVQPRPARALAGAVVAPVAGEGGIDKCPVDQRRHDQRDQRGRGQGERRAEPAGEQVGPHPADHADAGNRRRALGQQLRLTAMEGALGHLSTRAMRLLYQFMYADMSRLSTR